MLQSHTVHGFLDFTRSQTQPPQKCAAHTAPTASFDPHTYTHSAHARATGNVYCTWQYMKEDPLESIPISVFLRSTHFVSLEVRRDPITFPSLFFPLLLHCGVWRHFSLCIYDLRALPLSRKRSTQEEKEGAIVLSSFSSLLPLSLNVHRRRRES